ncbi:hypothetical protein D7X74_30405 [Corallococcus sp. CA047B]|uniref:phage adaptor protein n=1 Tax=Corallococcus sp. CA047B TaxID=2316729 RepID=UPI000EA38C93|nr:hypothetical protein [Corallococcus sp. CA047B]RKH08997.1 hypothetical protein D7X74_30405 [Corallococcus sp. CA047B]
MAWDNAASVLNDAAVELGLIPADLADPYDSVDSNMTQLCRLLKSAGQDLARDYAWTHLQKEYSFNTVASTGSYALPPDYDRLIDQTGWNRNSLIPLQGPLAAQGWQVLKALVSTGAVGLWFRIVGDQLSLMPVPISAQSLAYEYVSRYWVRPFDQTSPTTDTPTDGNDVLYFDRRLLVCAVKLAFKRAKGFDSTAAQEDFEKALARAQGGDGAAPVLSLNGCRVGPERLLNGVNTPDTGFGT